MGRGWEREKGLPTRNSALPPGPGKKKHFAKVTVGLLQKRRGLRSYFRIKCKGVCLTLFTHRQCALSKLCVLQ